MPSFEGATKWLHGSVTPEDFRGHPTIVQIWAKSCHLCREHILELRRCKECYRQHGVRFVSVHMPRNEEDTSIEEVEKAVEEYGMDEPVAIDNDHVIGDRFETGGIWPAYFLFDEKGELRARSAGEAGLGIIENSLDRILGFKAA